MTTTGSESAKQPAAFVVRTQNEPPIELMVIDCVVAPLDQKYDEPGLDVSVTEPP